MFPFRGMPVRAQRLAGILPLTPFLRILRDISLKGNGGTDIAPNVWPIALFFVAMAEIAL